ncbi:hypothetical protein [Candidatus Coxiella mudrowiae]|uniref:hypothetical protein n=1 Tax=Candidatus Coxiella mudrowiae TaxID=2054173 RepID=UPI000C2931AA|nr:hypothetical protein [Candidatus Coxiella mudrowiae]
MLLSTCNRTEIYTAAAEAEITPILKCLLNQPKLANTDIVSVCYSCRDLEGLIILFGSLVSGLDSMIVGEPQIFGQMKQAYEVACQEGCGWAQN